MKEIKPPSKLTRAQLREALDTVPIDSLFPAAASRELTAKQKRFARDVAMGKTKADAYRDNYNAKSKHTMTSKPYHLAADDRVKAEIEAIKRAISAQEYQTPAALRALVIQSLVGVITNPDSQPGQITAAAKVLGTVTEVAAFTERKEVRTITSSEDARAAIMAQLKQLTAADVQDVTAIDADADSLLAELAKSGESVTHRTPTPQADDAESLAYIHTIPHEQSAIPHEQSPSSLGSHFDSDIDPENPDGETPPPSTQETPPSSFKTRPTGG
jgi:ethanolamine utilization protein EutP (predicted NTPase)